LETTAIDWRLVVWGILNVAGLVTVSWPYTGNSKNGQLPGVRISIEWDIQRGLQKIEALFV